MVEVAVAAAAAAAVVVAVVAESQRYRANFGLARLGLGQVGWQPGFDRYRSERG